MVPFNLVNVPRTVHHIVKLPLLAAVFGFVIAAGGAPRRLAAQVGTAGSDDAKAAITQEEAAEFGESLVKAVHMGDIDTFSALLDWGAIVDIATRNPDVPELKLQRESFKKGVMRTVKRSEGMAFQIIAAIKKGGSYKVLRVNVKENEAYVIIRLVLPGGSGLNYHQFFISRTAAGRVVASDVYVFLIAERISDTVARHWRRLAAEELKSVAARAIAPPDAFYANVARILKFQDFINRERPVEALEEYQKFPEAVRRDKSMLILRMRAAQLVSNEEYAACIEDFRKYHPNDAALDFLLVGHYSLRKEYAEALKCLDRVNLNVGGDSVLLAQRANLLALLEKFDEARKAIQDAIAAEPDVSDPYMAGLDVSVVAKEFDDTVKYLNILEKRFGVQWKDLREVPSFQEFVKSPEYLKWAETRGM